MKQVTNINNYAKRRKKTILDVDLDFVEMLNKNELRIKF